LFAAPHAGWRTTGKNIILAIEMILIKQHNSHQVAHLYEHLFVMAVDDFFFKKKLFAYLDYEYTARTIYGVLYFAIDLHTEEAKKFEGDIHSLEIPLKDTAIHTAIIQLGSELKHNLGVVGKDTADLNAIREELLAIEKKPWQSIKDVSTIDPRVAKLVPGSLYIPQDKTILPVRKVNVTFALDKEFADGHKELLPLYNEINELMSENMRTDLYYLFGFYSMGKTRWPKDKAFKLIHAFHISETYPLNFSLVGDAVEDSLLDLYECKAFQRLITQLHDADHSKPDKIFPGVNYTFKQTGLIVGEKGWQRIATDENCDKILSHMKVTISTGRSRVSLNVTSTLDVE
jgi:hypothetical protein